MLCPREMQAADTPDLKQDPEEKRNKKRFGF
jgi:hypothetical protein